jgi:hypothetical protein
MAEATRSIIDNKQAKAKASIEMSRARSAIRSGALKGARWISISGICCVFHVR